MLQTASNFCSVSVETALSKLTPFGFRCTLSWKRSSNKIRPYYTQNQTYDCAYSGNDHEAQEGRLKSAKIHIVPWTGPYVIMVKVIPTGPEGSPPRQKCSQQRESTSQIPSRAERDDEHDEQDDDGGEQYIPKHVALLFSKVA
jgi:hypothetical protein